jgi:hypothetical protein
MMPLPAIILSAVVAANSPTPVEVWGAEHFADINYLREAIDHAVERSSYFSRSFGQKPGTLYIMLPQSLDRRSVGKRTAISAVIGFTHAPPNAPIEYEGTVRCWEDDMTACGDGTVALASGKVSP